MLFWLTLSLKKLMESSLPLYRTVAMPSPKIQWLSENEKSHKFYSSALIFAGIVKHFVHLKGSNRHNLTVL